MYRSSSWTWPSLDPWQCHVGTVAELDVVPIGISYKGLKENMWRADSDLGSGCEEILPGQMECLPFPELTLRCYRVTASPDVAIHLGSWTCVLTPPRWQCVQRQDHCQNGRRECPWPGANQGCQTSAKHQVWKYIFKEMLEDLWMIFPQNCHHILINSCPLSPVKIWPMYFLHANDVGIEVEAPLNVANHDCDMICLEQFRLL